VDAMKLQKALTFGLVFPLTVVFLFFPAAFAQVQTAGAGTISVYDQKTQADVSHSLENKRFADVKVAIANGIVTLSGTVETYSVKEDAEKRSQHVKNVKATENDIIVGGPSVSDSTLRQKLSEKLTYDRVGYGTTAFNMFTIGVQDGAVTLGGVAYGPMDKSSALGLVANYPGVKDVIDNIEVAPASSMDDRIRIAEARALYGSSQLLKYSIDPAKPIRITVVSGNVTLSGMVSSQADKDIAGIQANTVSGVFHVTNDLQVEGATKDK
jgi:osmotically-inducible protein OsmY